MSDELSTMVAATMGYLGLLVITVPFVVGSRIRLVSLGVGVGSLLLVAALVIGLVKET